MDESNYHIVWSDEAVEVANNVNELIKEGWRPLGGIAVSAMLKLEHGHHWVEMIFAQAMIREIIQWPISERARAAEVLSSSGN